MRYYLNVLAAVIVVSFATVTMASDWCDSEKAAQVQEELEYAKALEWFYSDEDYEGDVRTAERFGWLRSWPCGGC